jgi:hypothetical protein
MKNALGFFDDFIRNAQILVGSTVVLREDKPRNDSDPNWIPSVRETSDDALYTKHVADMRKRYPRIDWSEIKERDGKWRVIRSVKTV